YAAKLGQSGLVLRLRQGDQAAVADSLKAIRDTETPIGLRIELTRECGNQEILEAVPTLLRLLALDGESALKRVALQALARFDDERVSAGIIQRYGSTLPAEHGVRATALGVLASRSGWAAQMLDQVDLAVIKARETPSDVVSLIFEHGDSALTDRASQHWPELVPQATPPAHSAEAERLRRLVRAGSGNPEEGASHFTNRCAMCHQLFGKGREVGPDLTGYERENITFWLDSILAPSLELREGYLNYVATFEDGRKAIGMLRERTPETVTLRDLTGEDRLIDQTELVSLEASPVSLMPPGLLSGMSDQELRDLFAWLMKPE
ncbi:MAG: c-type cytochrome, partial [Verrucomicrobiota bacterium]